MDKRLNKIELLQNENWKFHLGEEPDAWRKDYDDTSWTEVILPHDWSVRKDFSKNYSSGMGYTTGGIAGTDILFFCRKNTKEKMFRFCLTEYIKTALYGATAIIKDIGRMDMRPLV